MYCGVTPRILYADISFHSKDLRRFRQRRAINGELKLKSHTGQLPRPRLRIPGLLREITSTLVFVIAVTVLFDLAIPRSLVDGHSMEPTFYSDDRLVVSRIHYLLGTPQRGASCVQLPGTE